jgi:ankyrin repeat protein
VHTYFFLSILLIYALYVNILRFRWVTCQLDHLCELSTDAQRRKALHELPATLNETYERILARVKPHDIPLVRRILLWTTYASPKLNINELLEVVSIEEDDECIDLEARIDEEQILQCCSSLIRKRAETFELAHFTVQEYLEKMGDVNLLDYQYSSNPALHLAQTCLTYLCFSDFDKPPPATVNDIDTRNTQHPFLEHATKFWLTYAAGYLDNFELYGQIQHLFQPKRSYNFISYAVSLFFFTSEYFTGRTEAFQQAIEMATAGDFGPLHVAALLGLKELCEWLLAEGYDVNQSSPIGTPIDCCIFGLEHSVWRGMELDKGEPDFGDDNVTNLTNLRLDAIIALLDAGANCKTEVRNGDSMGLAALYRFDHASIFSFLVKSGMPIEDDAMEFLQDTDSNVILKSLLQVIQDAADLNITIEQRNMILNLGILSEIETASSLLRDESISLEQFSDLAEGAIKFDQLEIFEALIEQSAFTVDMCLPGSDGTLLHMAARDHSIKVMQALLNFGFDPSRTTNDGHTVLYECVTLQNDNIMRRLIENPNCIRPDSFGRTVWHQAAWSGASRTLELLIEKYGASCSDAYLVSTNGESPLLEAIITGNETVSLLLLEVSKKNRKTIEDWRLVHYCIANGLSKVLDELVQLGVNLAVHSESQKSALHFLTKHTSLSSLETLLGQGLNPNEQDLHGKSALHTFLDGSRHAELDKAGVILNADCLTLPILERLVIPEGAILKDREGFMPWYYYCKKYVPRVLKTGPLHLQMFKRVGEMLTRRGAVAGFNKNQKVQSALSLLIEGCLDTIKPGLNLIAEPVSELHKAISDLLLSILKDHTLSSTTKGDVQLTRLLIWSIESHEDILCKALLIHGVEINARSTFWNGRNAIEAVCLVDNVEQHMFETILRYADIDSLNQNDWAGWSPIHHLSVAANANWKESSEKLETLLKFGADPNIRTRKDQFTAVNLAASKGHVEAFRSLLRHNAYIHLQTEYGWGVVAYAIASGSVDMMEELLEQIEDGALWKHKFSIAAPWDSSESLPLCSALHLAALVSEEILEILANSGHYQDFDETNRAGYTPLHLASSGPYRTTANWLISHGVDANAVTTNGMTALHFAVQSGNIRTVKALIVAGARFTPDKLGRSPEVLAPARALDDILRLLQELEVSDSVLQNLQTNEIAQELFSTIRLGNLDTCRLIIEKNESWKSLRSPECGICTALALALSAEHWGIVDLLLENSVPLSGTVCAKHFPSIFPSMLLVHVAIAKPEFNSRLQRFLDMLLTHQEHWVHSPLNPFHVAVYYNPASIDTLWSHIQKNGEILA